MPTDALTAPARAGISPIAARRILRLALGTALSMAFSQIFNWPLSFVSAVFTMFILALPIPAPGLKSGIKFVIALMAPVIAGLALLPFLDHARIVGVLLVALALFYSFYYTARGGSPVMGTFMTVGLTLVVTIGSVSIDVMLMLVQGLAMGAVAGLAFVWVAHALLPDLPREQPARPPAAQPAPDLREARRSALRSMLIVFPMALIFMMMSGSPAYTVVMIKVASMGQQASTMHSRAMGRSLLESTLWGGLGAIVAWNILTIWPSLTLYVLLLAVACLLFGRGIFQNASLHPKFSMWSYALLTMIVILAPAVMDGQNSDGAGAAFWSRLMLFGLIAVYGTVSVAVFDAFWPARK